MVMWLLDISVVFRKICLTGKSRLAIAALFSFVADASSDTLRLAVLRAGRDVAGRTLEVFVALALAARAQAGPVPRARQVMTLARARIDAANETIDGIVKYVCYKHKSYDFLMK